MTTIRFLPILLLLLGCATTPNSSKPTPNIHVTYMGFELVGYVENSIPYRDEEYNTISQAQVKSLPLFRVSGTQDDDCDDAAFRCSDYVWKKFRTKDKGKAFGPVYVKLTSEGIFKLLGNPQTTEQNSRHALCIFFDENKEPQFYEPQTGVILPVFDSVELGFIEILTPIF